ncbi:MAG: NADH-quinone oxidoreductase subunit I [Clostridia bacterium]|jgi:NADH-quinone oxidoreductase subunit I|nr:NADH-quinone oxidoreductase subunit I [Clostridia bacterium]
MFGKGLLKGLGVTGRVIFRKKVTEKYPDVQPQLAERWRGGFQLDVSQCIACGLCERNCPNGAIKMSTSKDENNKKQLASYELNFSYCLLCGLCVEGCPKHCLRFTQEFENAVYHKDQVILDLFNNQNLSAPMSTYGLPGKKEVESEREEK